MSSKWPPELKQFVNETFAKCTDANRQAVETELKQVIYQAFEKGQLHSTDWKNFKLKSLSPPNKRKAFLPSTPASNGIAPGLPDEEDRRAKRAKRFEQQMQGGAAGSAPGTMGQGRLVQGGVHSYGSGGAYGAVAMTPDSDLAVYDPNVIDWDQHTIVGKSQKLEKPYLRLTTLPNPNTIRPLEVLKQTLELIKRKWREEGNYGYICDQFKSMRQDLIVQRITNDFTVQVYEIHARIALEKGDLGEFNQCQSRLHQLYRLGLGGHPEEFLGYRILYLLFSRNRAELNSTLAELDPEQTRDNSVAHALSVRLALSQGNYTKFFRLFNSAPKMGAYVMDHFVARERVTALVTMCKAYSQGLPLRLVTSQLAFDTDQEAHEFLESHHAALYKPSPPDTQLGDRQLDAKRASGPLAEVLGKFQVSDLKGQI
ncbi:SAC3/GANP/Nin1/mts3/eIF-3 p25 family-domain-containing protein [Rhodotorula diobovata]|uniref:SAC3/GANP/Nin1/mts3/eIF-3 p25 family-domain-containing protein n=1 Tax=Rhodotorula diobovata TaxID=5288 RepID=A0A5C5FT16_9BASI|nr:SAC3/GANP/Nin1/mts3/eIF-3 p25 family-domain-containing protein [Rhodotorula diobovata]